MTKTKQNLILFIEPSIDPWSSPSKMGNSYINRFVIDEEAGFELLGVYYLSKWGDVSQNEKYPCRQKNIEDRFFDKELIDSGVTKAAEYQTERLNTHFIFAGDHLIIDFEPEIANAMKIHKIKNILVTKLHNERQYLITKELMEEIYNGECYNGKFGSGAHFTNRSFFDDLELFYKKVKFRCHQKACTNRFGHAYSVHSFFLPKLTNTELKLVETKDKDYLKTFRNDTRDDYDLDYDLDDPDVPEREMKLSESKSKFVLVDCHRWTFIISMTGEVPSIYPTRTKCWTKRFGTDWEIWVPH